MTASLPGREPSANGGLLFEHPERRHENGGRLLSRLDPAKRAIKVVSGWKLSEQPSPPNFRAPQKRLASRKLQGTKLGNPPSAGPVSYTHLTLPTNREV